MTTCSLAGIRLVLAGHGSRDQEGIAEFEAFANLFKTYLAGTQTKHGYLEFQKPTIEAAVAEIVTSGEGPIVIVPALLAAATHAKNDMPGLLHQLQQRFPQEDIRFAAVMDLHAKLLELCRQRLAFAESNSQHSVKRSDTSIVVVGRGTTDPDANGDIAKLTRMLQEGMSFDAGITCYSGTAHPLVDAGLAAAAKLGHKRIIVLPYFLFDGTLVKRIYAAADTLQKRLPNIEVLKAKYLGVNEEVASVLAERAHEAIHGKPYMNCGLCKYRTPIVGYETQVGLPQAAHRELTPFLIEASMPESQRRTRQVQLNSSPGQSNSSPLQSDSSPVEANSSPVQPNSSPGRPNSLSAQPKLLESPSRPYEPHPIEAESFQIIRSGYDWSTIPEEHHSVLMRLVHTTGDFDCLKDVFFSAGAVQTGIRALLRCRRIVTDVTMVQTGLKRSLLAQMGIDTWCGVHHQETAELAQTQNITRSAAGIRKAWMQFGNDLVLAIGDAPTAVTETVRLIREQGFRPQLVVALPVGFVGTAESKELLKSCIQVPRITNSGTRGGSPWAAATINAMLIGAAAQFAGQELTKATVNAQEKL